MDRAMRSTQQVIRLRTVRPLAWTQGITLVFLVGTVCHRLDAQVVQLPSWRVFSVQTSVLVPDQGSALLGGVNQTTWTQGAFGPPLLPGPFWGNAPYLSTFRGARFASVSAQILDNQAMDRAVLAEARRRPDPSAPLRGVGDAEAIDAVPRDPQAAWIEAHLLRPPEDPAGQLSVTEWNARKQALRQITIENHRDQVVEFVRHGDDCRERGDLRVAAMFYRRALRLAEPELAVQIEARIAQLKTIDK